MLNKLSNLTAGIFASGGLSDAVDPFDRTECLGVLLDIDDDITMALDMLDVLNENNNAPVMVNLKWSMQVLDYACLLMGLRELVRNVQTQISLSNVSSDAVVVLNAVKANNGGHSHV